MYSLHPKVVCQADFGGLKQRIKSMFKSPQNTASTSAAERTLTYYKDPFLSDFAENKILLKFLLQENLIRRQNPARFQSS